MLCAFATKTLGCDCALQWREEMSTVKSDVGRKKNFRVSVWFLRKPSVNWEGGSQTRDSTA